MKPLCIEADDPLRRRVRQPHVILTRGVWNEALRRAAEPSKHLQHAVTFRDGLRAKAGDGRECQRPRTAICKRTADLANERGPRELALLSLRVKGAVQIGELEIAGAHDRYDTP